MKRAAFLLSLLIGALALALYDRQRPAVQPWVVTAKITDLHRDQAELVREELSELLNSAYPGQYVVTAGRDA